MSDRSGPIGSKLDLDDLVSRMPHVGGEPSSSEWATRLERTMQRIQSASLVATTELDLDAVLRTPLPVESGEPEPLDPYGFEATEGALYDDLRAPLQSGEHAPLHLPRHAADPAPELDRSARTLRPALAQRTTLPWVAAAIGTLAAAAAAILYVQRAPESQLASSLGLEQITAPQAEPSPSATIAQAANANVNASETNANAPGTVTPGAVTPGAAVANLDVAATQQPKSNIESTGAIVEANRTVPASAQHVARNVGATSKAAKDAVAAKPSALEPTSSEPELTPAAGPVTLEDHPTSGAVMSALSRVAPEAQRCLSPNLPKAPIHLVFGATGHVQRVDVTGANVDARTRDCLTNAYSKAQLQPFARAQYEVNTTVSVPSGP